MLGNFSYVNPTKLYFGDNSLSYLKDELKKYGKKVLLIYGGGSIKRIGLYDEIIKILHESNKEVFEDKGVMPNPTIDKLYEGCKIAFDNKVDFILAVGGGSVIDYAKAVSVSTYCKEDPWDKYFLKQEDVDNQIIPLGSILTMVGTGSEMNGGSVITNPHTKLKIGHVFDERVFPKFSILNPIYTYSVPKYQMVAGFFDIMSHIMEQYFSGFDDNTSDYVMEGLMRSLIHSSLIAVKEPTNYEARSNIMWIATWALNTFVGEGKTQDWMVHMIGQAIGGVNNSTHGMTLSSISLEYYRYIKQFGLPKFVKFAKNVFNVNCENKTDDEIAISGIDELEKWMKSIGVATKLSEINISEKDFDDIIKGTIISDSGYKKLTEDEIRLILKKSL